MERGNRKRGFPAAVAGGDEEAGEKPMSIATAAARASASMHGDAAGRDLGRTRRSGYPRPSDVTSPNLQGNWLLGYYCYILKCKS